MGPDMLMQGEMMMVSRRHLLVATSFIVFSNICGTSASSENANWGPLAQAIVRGDLATVRSIVPSKIAVDAKNPAGKTALEIAQNAKKLFDEVAAYLQLELKAEQSKPSEWTPDHVAVSRLLQNVTNSALAGNITEAQSFLQSAIKKIQTIRNPQAKNPEGFTLAQQAHNSLELINSVLSKIPAGLAPDMKMLDDLLFVPEPTKEDIQSLKDSVDSGFLEGVKKIVPSKIKANAQLNNRTVASESQDLKRKHDDIVNYLQSLPVYQPVQAIPASVPEAIPQTEEMKAAAIQNELVKAVKEGRAKVVQRAINSGVQLAKIHDESGNNLLYLLAEGAVKQQTYYRQVVEKLNNNQTMTAKKRADQLAEIEKNKKGTDDHFVGMLNVLRTCGKECMKEMYFPTTGGRVFSVIEKELDPKSEIYRELWHELTDLAVEGSMTATLKEVEQLKSEKKGKS